LKAVPGKQDQYIAEKCTYEDALATLMKGARSGLALMETE
jgi:hypothetical protein